MRSSFAWIAVATLLVPSVTVSPFIQVVAVDAQALVRDESSALLSPGAGSPSLKTDVAALDEMLRDSKGQLQYWTSVPELVVLTSVMQYHTTDSREFVATGELLDAKETRALSPISGSPCASSPITPSTTSPRSTTKRVPAGSRAGIVRPKQIVVGRFQGLDRPGAYDWVRGPHHAARRRYRRRRRSCSTASSTAPAPQGDSHALTNSGTPWASTTSSPVSRS